VIAGSSLKAALDLDWDDPEQQARALAVVLGAIAACERQLAQAVSETVPPGVPTALAVARQIEARDVVEGKAGRPVLRQGVAPERRISVEDAGMRHGRESKSLPVDGYKRHVLHDLDRKLIVAVGVTPANVPEATVTDQIAADIDRAYLSSRLVRERPPALRISRKAWPVRTGPDGHYAETASTLEREAGTIRCPDEVSLPFQLGGTARFPASTCAACLVRERRTSSSHGRSVTIHPDERLLQELRERQQTPAGRAKLRERTAVEHTLAHIGQWQGRNARYLGQRKNLFDLRRTAAVHNLHVLMRQPQSTDEAAA
jgi:hypothetical protein